MFLRAGYIYCRSLRGNYIRGDLELLFLFSLISWAFAHQFPGVSSFLQTMITSKSANILQSLRRYLYNTLVFSRLRGSSQCHDRRKESLLGAWYWPRNKKQHQRLPTDCDLILEQNTALMKKMNQTINRMNSMLKNTGGAAMSPWQEGL